MPDGPRRNWVHQQRRRQIHLHYDYPDGSDRYPGGSAMAVAMCSPSVPRQGWVQGMVSRHPGVGCGQNVLWGNTSDGPPTLAPLAKRTSPPALSWRRAGRVALPSTSGHGEVS